MVPILLNFDDLTEEFKLSKDQVTDLTIFTLNEVAGRVFWHIQEEAKKGLNSSRSEYLKSLNLYSESKYVRSINLTGDFANGLESGKGAYDMKIGFAKSLKTTKGEGGSWYLSIPFRFGTPTSIGENFSGVMPDPVYQIAKNNNGKKISTEQLQGTGYESPLTRKRIVSNSKVFEAYTHKSSIYQGIRRVSKEYDRANQGKYVSFRRVSSNSDPLSWIHSGLAAKNFFEKGASAANIPTLIGKTTDDYLEKLFN